MVRHLHRLWARAVDEVSFGAINALHLRHDADAGRLRDYIAGWSGASFEEYYGVTGAGAAAAAAALDALPEIPRHLRFPSPLPGAFAANNLAAFDLYPAPAGWTAPTFLIAHGLMSVSDVGYRAWAARLNAQGWNVVFVHLPYHYARRPAGYLSGELSVSPDLVRTAEGARQSVIELRLLLRWLAARGGRLFAASGTSYGAWIMALLGCVEPLVGRLILVEPILDLQAAIWDSPACATVRRVLRRRGITPELTAAHLRLCCPLHAPPRLDPRHVLLLAGTYDRIAPPATIRALHEKWAGSHFHEFPQGHVGYRLLPESFRLAAELWPEDFPSSVDGGAR